jgi:MFS family permease
MLSKDSDSVHDMILDIDKEKRSEQPQVTTVIEVPDGGYGWFVVLGVFLLSFATWAANSGYSIYLAYYLQHNKFEGATKIDYAGVGGIAFGAGLVLGPLVRLFTNYTSIKTCIAVGAIIQFAGTILAAFSTKLWQIFLTQGLLIGIGMGMICIPATTLIAQWFRAKRSMAQAIAAAGSGVGGVVFNLGVQQMIKNFSLRWALIIQAIMCAFCNTMGFLLVRQRNKHIQTESTVWDNRLFKYPVYWMFLFYISTTQLGYVVLLYNLADFTISLGYSAHQGSVVACMVSVGIVFGRPLVGRLSDRFGPVTTSLFAQAFVGILCLAMWIPARNYATAIAFALLQGATMGSIWVVIASIATRVVGLRRLDVAMTMVWIFIGSFGMVSPIIGIKLRGVAPEGQSYDPSQYRNPAIYCGICYLASALALWVMRGYLISRDQEAHKLGSQEDNDEMNLPVGFGECMRNMFVLSEKRKV